MIFSFLNKIFSRNKPDVTKADTLIEVPENKQKSLQVGDEKIVLEYDFGAYYRPGKQNLFFLITQSRDPQTNQCIFKLQDVKSKKVYKIPADLFNAIFERAH